MSKILALFVLLGICTLAKAIDVSTISHPRQLHVAIIQTNKAADKINIGHIRNKLHAKPEDVDLHEIKKSIEDLLQDVAGLKNVLDNKLKQKLPQKSFNRFTTRLRKLGGKLRSKLKWINTMLSTNGCVMKKASFNTLWKHADVQFNTFLARVEQLNTDCTNFSKVCVKKYIAIKEQFLKFNQERVEKIRGILGQLKHHHCFASQVDRAHYNKKLLDLECRTEGIILFIQGQIKDLIGNELKEIHTIAKGFNDRMNVLKSNTTTDKEELREILNEIKDIFHKSIDLKGRFSIVYECLFDLKQWLLPEEFEHVFRTANVLYYDLGAYCWEFENEKMEFDQKFKTACIMQDLSDKEIVLGNLTDDLNVQLGRYGSDESLLCTNLTDILKEMKHLKIKIQECVSEISDIKVTLFKKIENPSAALTNRANTLTSNADMALKTAEKNHYFLNIFDILYCIDHEDHP